MKLVLISMMSILLSSANLFAQNSEEFEAALPTLSIKKVISNAYQEVIEIPTNGQEIVLLNNNKIEKISTTKDFIELKNTVNITQLNSPDIAMKYPGVTIEPTNLVFKVEYKKTFTVGIMNITDDTPGVEKFSFDKATKTGKVILTDGRTIEVDDKSDIITLTEDAAMLDAKKL